MSDINIYEVGPRDGLQNSNIILTTKEKISMIEKLYNANLKNIEVTSFVHPKIVPNMVDAEAVFNGTKHLDNFDVLVPNKKGFERAKDIGVKNFNIFFSPSDEFNIRNLGKSLYQIYPEIKDMVQDTKRENIRAYISCTFGCPFSGKPRDNQLRDVFEKAYDITDNIVLCDTIGTNLPTLTLQTLELTKDFDFNISLHLHQRKEMKRDMFVNVKAALDWGVTNFDSSIAGLGGCPFIPNSGSNLSTNELIKWSIQNNYETGVDLWDLQELTSWIIDKNNTTLSKNTISMKSDIISSLSAI